MEKYSSYLKPDKVSWVDITFTEEKGDRKGIVK